MSGVDLPTGLRGAYEELSIKLGDTLRRLTSIVWLRMLLDPSCPEVGGIDPRSLVTDRVPWEALDSPAALDAAGARFNEILGCGELLAVDWHLLPETTVQRVISEVRRWQPDGLFAEGGDVLGEISQRVRSSAAKSARGEYYTPYNVSLAMAKMTDSQPGWNVLDPACGSGRMLLAALQACREDHGGVPDVYGIDISPDAVRLCQLNLALAGIAPKWRVECADFLRMAAPEELNPVQRAMQIKLFEFEAGEQVGWRKRDVA